MNLAEVYKMEKLETRIKELEGDKNIQKNTQRGGVSFLGLLTLLFIGLKLGNVITWSWWWVLSPLWIIPAGWLCFMIMAFIAAFIVIGIVESINK